MNLPFMTAFAKGLNKLGNTPTHFAERILTGLMYEEMPDVKPWLDQNAEKLIKNNVDLIGDYTPKVHTIRVDSKRRWKVGNKIHFYYNSRTPNMFQFAPVVTCTGVQKISIKWSRRRDKVSIMVDGRNLSSEEREQLAVNDGFSSYEDFLIYFNQDFNGVLIHWTQLKY